MNFISFLIFLLKQLRLNLQKNCQVHATADNAEIGAGYIERFVTERALVEVRFYKSN